MSDLSLITIEDLGDLLESGSTGLNVEDGNKDEFEEDPALDVISKESCGRELFMVELTE